MKSFLLSVFLLFISGSVWANNIKVGSPTVTNESGANPEITFSVTWDNSWRCAPSHAPFNWDAAWVFIKFLRNDEAHLNNWRHVTVASSSVGSNGELETPADKKGVFLYRKNAGNGRFTEEVSIKWDRAADGALDKVSEFCAYAVEMVYVPTGAFDVGDGTVFGFYTGGSAIYAPYRIQNEGAINIGRTANSLASYFCTSTVNSSWPNYPGLAGNIYTAAASTGTLPAAFPKGYQHFYCMKTEISQGQYAAFLNKIQGTNIATNATGIHDMSLEPVKTGDVVPSNHGYTITRNPQGVYSASAPGRACNMLTSQRVAAYLCWAALRPMTELEYEKACRGTLAPWQREYAWGGGGLGLRAATGYASPDTPNETYTLASVTPNAHLGRISGLDRPGRVGAFARGTSDRAEAGAAFYGILDMTGNVAEMTVVLAGAGLTYNGSHGSGHLGSTGVTFPNTWPVGNSAVHVNITGYGHRGGDYHYKPLNAIVANYDPSQGYLSHRYTIVSHNGPTIPTGADYDFSYGTRLMGYYWHPNPIGTGPGMSTSASGATTYYVTGYGGRGVRTSERTP